MITLRITSKVYFLLNTSTHQGGLGWQSVENNSNLFKDIVDSVGMTLLECLEFRIEHYGAEDTNSECGLKAGPSLIYLTANWMISLGKYLK